MRRTATAVHHDRESDYPVRIEVPGQAPHVTTVRAYSVAQAAAEVKRRPWWDEELEDGSLLLLELTHARITVAPGGTP